MNEQLFKSTYNESRNGANQFYRHPLALGGSFIYSDGVQECAELGCYWLLDILATELKVGVGDLAIVTINVDDSKAKIEAKLADEAPPVLSKRIEFTDMPDGEWTLYVSNDGDGRVCILPSEY